MRQARCKPVMRTVMQMIQFHRQTPMQTMLREIIYMTLIAVAMALVMIPCADAEELPAAMLVEPLKPHTSVEAAARDVLEPLLAKTDGVEWGGAILECEGHFFATQAVTQNKEHGVNYMLMSPKTCKLAGMYHSHPRPDEVGGLFSDTDINNVRKMRIPSYIGVVFDRSVRRLVPGRQKVFDILVDRKQTIASFGEKL